MWAPKRAGELDALVHRRLAERHEGDDVDGADARVLALVLRPCRCCAMATSTAPSMATATASASPAKVSTLRLWSTSDVRSSRWTPASRPRGGDGIDDLGAPTLAEVGDALDQLCHRASVGAGLAPGDAARADDGGTPSQAAGCTSTGFGAAGADRSEVEREHDHDVDDPGHEASPIPAARSSRRWRAGTGRRLPRGAARR